MTVAPSHGTPQIGICSIPTPKPRALDNWYKYYAGFSEAFVAKTLDHLQLVPHSIVLDPWNGSGTTTAVARALGHRARGYDLNPAMVVVAKARLLEVGVLPSVASITAKICAEARARRSNNPNQDDPLSTWFAPDSVRHFRAIENALRHILVEEMPHSSSDLFSKTEALSTLAAFLYVGLFQAARSFLTPFISSNPTWLRTPPTHHSRVRPSDAAIRTSFTNEVAALTERLATRSRTLQPDGADSHILGGLLPHIALGNSGRITDADHTIDAVVSSPPYCTRIDYAVATRAELAILGMSESAFSKLRRSLLGTTAPNDHPHPTPQRHPSWGPTCLAFLDLVANHPTKAAASYYLPGYQRYFAGLYSSIREIWRVLKLGAPCVLVVQDSHFKGEPTALPEIVTEIADGLGLRLSQRCDYRHITKAAVNPRARKYRSITHATESALFFSKQA